ncbi:serine carboxypeptidase-like 19 isoform X2 [Prosopis cineraria]|uniref:serine carboxypeptidase-like 19 isoform X2 n=1 Tax=Prosopis cineraria TaxID=364024 RepID=UPI00240FC652|nr:serine carboxypeptidase-like 19 isoform X2 [Prosopis cineraria]
MARVSSKHSDSVFYGYSNINITVLLWALLSQIWPQPVTCRSTLEFLPGFHGRLPFQLQTGYVGVGESSEVEVFYYFIESENNPQEDPLLIWFSGGPGCTSFVGLASEIGPIAFVDQEYNGSLPSLVLRPQSWTKAASIIFPDLPVGAGFSYAKTEAANQSGDWVVAHHAYQFLRKWLMDHPEYLSHKVYVCGDSYAGIHIPAFVQEISYGNENGVQPLINIQGYILGNPITTRLEVNYQITFAHGMGLISDELHESLQKNCKAQYANMDPKNLLCLRDFQLFQELTAEIDHAMILEPAFCGYDNLRVLSPRNSLMKRSLTQKVKANNFPSKCRRLGYTQETYWANNDHVRKALHVRKGTVGCWKRCNSDINYKYGINSSFYIHANLSAKGYRSLIYRSSSLISILNGEMIFETKNQFLSFFDMRHETD